MQQSCQKSEKDKSYKFHIVIFNDSILPKLNAATNVNICHLSCQNPAVSASPFINSGPPIKKPPQTNDIP